MNRRITTALAVALFVPALALAADEKPKMPQMTPEQQAEMDAYMKAGALGEPHKMLAEAVGQYSATIKEYKAPGAPPVESTAAVTRTLMLDGRVLVEEFKGNMMDMPFTGYGMHGYDNVTGKYWSTWNDSMSTGIMVSEGTCDAKKNCTYTGSWNDPITKAPKKAQMTTKWTSPTTQVFEMRSPGKDGKEFRMEITYTKK